LTWIATATVAAAGSDAIVHCTAGPEAEQVTPLGAVAETYSSSRGRVSRTTTAVAVPGPLLWAASVNEMVSPRLAVPGPVLVMPTSAVWLDGGGDEDDGGGGGGGVPACGVVRVAELLPVFGSVTPVGAATVAVFVNVPVVFFGTVPARVITAEAPDARLTDVETFPVPDDGEQPDGHVQPKPSSGVGTVSATVAPVTAPGPLLVTVIVYVNCLLGEYEARDAVLVMERSA
jgi:hypothetical protein